MMNKRLLIFILGILVVGCSTNTKDDKITFISLAWQEQTLNTHKSIVAEWNNLHKNKQVEYVQSNWSSIHDYLITSFETG